MNVVVSAHTIALDAHIIKGRLEAEGIPALVQDDQYITMDWMLSAALGGVKVSVPEPYQEAAIAILQSTESNTFERSLTNNEALLSQPEAEFLPEIPMQCPVCEGFSISRIEWLRQLSLIILFMFHSPLAFSQRHYSCDHCDHVFNPDKNSSSFMFAFAAVLSILVTMLVVFASALFSASSTFQPDSYLSRSNGPDMVFTIDDPPSFK